MNSIMIKMSLRIGCRVDDPDKHTRDVNCMLYKKGKLFSGADDGKIKVWSMDLLKLAEVQAHPSTVFSIAASDDTLFSCSNDGSVKAFDLDTLKPKGNIIHENLTQFWKLFYDRGCLYAGDDEGTIKIWKNGHYYGSFLTAEPVKDIAVSHHNVFTVKDSDVSITEVKVDGETLQYGTKTSFMGRGPIALVGEVLFAFVSRNGKDIVIHENKEDVHFRELTQVQGAHELIINSLSGTIWNNKPILFSGGWDKQIKKWLIDEDIVKNVASVDAQMVVNSIVIGDKGEIYAGGVDGHIIRVEVE
ncbi:hypothetical protein NQ317_009801 [Molorchus minor]|uniref:Uncharacterized protein n=1 Tax=Molorchus minor TaxID=1323400 RepID=A0ABQ9JV11_9CUCU|nr:hypothetical protein NQ317_009801 [Molorchus minor]